jgi:DNA repair exonuclease SbcCD ATPase subunit
MQNILKRLELIKTAIAIEDEEIIALQVDKLQTMNTDADVQNILAKIADNDYGNVVSDIENYIDRFSGVVVYEDKELQGLRLELKVLENKLQELSEEKSEYLNAIDEFNTQYHLKLGDILQKILKLREELLHKAVKEKEETFTKLKKEYEALKEESSVVENKIDTLQEELDNTDEFDDKYDVLYEELQALKEELRQKKEALNEKRKETKEAKKALDEDDVSKEYQESKKDYEEFNKEHKEILEEERFELTADEQNELKKLFRKAARLCHPDIVAKELKEQALIIIQELNNAYAKKDLEKVKEILHSLESGKSFDIASDTITNVEVLREKIAEIRNTIVSIEKELAAIKEDEVTRIIEENKDLNKYFESVKEQLESEYERLKTQNNDLSGGLSPNSDETVLSFDT